MDDKHHSLINPEIETSSSLFMWMFIPQKQVWAARTWTGDHDTVGDAFWVVVIFLKRPQAEFCVVKPRRLLFMTQNSGFNLVVDQRYLLMFDAIRVFTSAHTCL